jgi:lipoprotein-anchoring transpeptidase ErfK/SrfK
MACFAVKSNFARTKMIRVFALIAFAAPNEPETIGEAVSSGCFRMTNDDVTDLHNRVSVGTTVVVKN